MNLTALERTFVARLENVLPPKWFEPADLHMKVIGIRMNRESHRFDDFIGLVANLRGELFIRLYPATTDPGVPWLLKPIVPEGTAILPPGLHKDLWTRGRHKGRYDALVQFSAVDLYRDNDGDSLPDGLELVHYKRSRGINLHRAGRGYTERNANQILQKYVVGRWSAGCQVVASSKHFSYFMWFVDECTKQDTFSYFLLDNHNKKLFDQIKTDPLGRIINIR